MSRPKGITSIRWNQNEQALVIHNLAIELLANPQQPFTRAFDKVQKQWLPKARQASKSAVINSKSRYSGRVAQETQRIIEQRAAAKLIEHADKQREQEQQTIRLEEQSLLKHAATAGVVGVQPVSSPQPTGLAAVDAKIVELADLFASYVRTRLIEQLSNTPGVALAEVVKATADKLAGGAPEAPPTIPVQVIGAAPTKLKVGLLGAATADDKYFAKLSAGLETAVDFIRVKSLGDTTKLWDCDAVVMSSDVPQAWKTAVEHIAKNAKKYVGLASNQVNDALTDSWLERNNQDPAPTVNA